MPGIYIKCVNISEMLPLMMMFMGGTNKDKNGANSFRADSPGADGAAGGAPNFMEILGAMQNGGDPSSALMDVMFGGNPQMRRMMSALRSFDNSGAGGNGGAAAQSAVKGTINELKPIRHIVPDAIHDSMDEYLKKKGY